jgi:hypothetical protein
VSGVKIIRSLLVSASPVIALVPVDRIVAGVLKTGVLLPALAITDVVGIDYNIVKAGTTHQVMDRVQVTACATTYAELKAVMKAIRTACRDKIGAIAGFVNVTVHTDGKGPDFTVPDSGIYMQTQDFRITYTEDA